MALTKLDRATTAKVQEIIGIPNSITRGNICVSSTGPSLYYKYGSTWYSASGGSGGGVFEASTGSYSARRSGSGITVSGSYSFAMGDVGSVAGTRSASFGGNHTVSSNYSFAAGINNSFNSTAHYSVIFGSGNAIAAGAEYSTVSGTGNVINSTSISNAVFGYSNTVSSNSNRNIVAGRENTVGGSYHSVFGYNNTIATSSSFSIIAGSSNSISAVVCSTAFGYGNTVTSSYSLTQGNANINSKSYAIATGKYAETIWEGARHFSGVMLDGSTEGSSMGIDGIVLTAQTSGVSTVIFTLDSVDGSGTNPLYCPDGCTIIAGVRVVGISSSGSASGIEVWDFNIVIERHEPSSFNVTGFAMDGGSSATTNIWDKGSDIGSIGVFEDAVNNKAIIRATGVTGTVTNWTAHIYKGICIQGSYHYGGS